VSIAAVIGGLGASLMLPAMQSLIHGNFQGAAQKKAYASVGAAAAVAAAVGPLLGGFITTYLSWRLGFILEVVIIAIVLSGMKLVHDVPYTGPRRVDAVGAVALGSLVYRLQRRKREDKPTLIDPDLFRSAGSGSGSPGRCSSRSRSAAR
jgi:MFS family permease